MHRDGNASLEVEDLGVSACECLYRLWLLTLLPLCVYRSAVPETCLSLIFTRATPGARCCRKRVFLCCSLRGTVPRQLRVKVCHCRWFGSWAALGSRSLNILSRWCMARVKERQRGAKVRPGEIFRSGIYLHTWLRRVLGRPTRKPAYAKPGAKNMPRYKHHIIFNSLLK